MKHKLIAGLLAAAATIPMGVAAASAAPASGGGSTTIAQVLLGDSAADDANGFDRRWLDYDIATQAVLLFPDLVAAASDPSAQLTVFLPTDLAFRRLVADLTGTWPRSEAATFDAVAALGTDTVRAVLTYHLVAGPPIGYRDALRSDGAELATWQGGTLTVDVGRFGLPYVQLVANDPDAPDPIVVQPEIGRRLANGYVHGISAVLRPLDL